MDRAIESALISVNTIRGTFRVFDLIDIAVLSYVIYKLLLMLRKSSSGRVMRGILMLVLAMGLCSAMRLYATGYLLSKAVEWGIVVLVVLFQPEIRLFLERMGSGGLGLGSLFTQNAENPHDLEHAIRETVDAYSSMSRDKVGALMVFERDNLLDDVIKTGTPLDCSISSELLKNIFWNKAPLHDGAVIVRGGRIVGAGCMLPLSGNTNLSRDLGMRHRAGIGMSEHSDAVVIMVSEETGSISTAVGGVLRRHLAPETLERLLKNEIMVQSEGEEKKNPSLPIFSTLLSRVRGEEDET